MRRPRKSFDAVAMMREARDRISVAIEGLTLEEERAWLAAQRIDDPLLRRLLDRSLRRPRASATRRRR